MAAKNVAIARRDRSHAVGRWWVVAWLLYAAICAAAIAYFAEVVVPHERAAAIELWRGRLSAMADDREAAITAWLDERRADARVVSEYPTVAVLLAGQRAVPQPLPPLELPERHLQRLLDSLGTAYAYTGVYVIGSTGQVVASSTGSPPLGVTYRQMNSEVIESGLAKLDFLAREDGLPMLAIVAPVRVGGRTAGTVLLSVDPKRWLYPLLRSEPIPSATGESLLARQVEGQIEFLSPLRHRPVRPLSFRLPTNTPSLAAVAAISGERGLHEYQDYWGVPVLGAARSIPGTGWDLVVKVDRDEALAAFRRGVWQGALAIVAVLLAVAGLGFGAQHAMVARYRTRLGESEERFRRLSEAAFEGIVVTDQGRIVDVNAPLAEILRCAPAELIGRSALDFVDPADHGLVLEHFRSGSEDAYEHVMVRADGTRFPAEVQGRPLPYGGKTLRVTAIRDITERKGAEKTLRESELQFRTLAETTGVGIFVVQNDLFTYANPEAERMTGYTAQELAGMRLLELVHPDFHELVRQRAAARLAGAQDLPTRYEIKGIVKGGAERWFSLTSGATVLGGKPALVVSITDVSDEHRLRAEQATLYQISEAAQSVATLDDLYRAIHTIIDRLMEAKNLFIALYDPVADLVSFPYHVDEEDEPLEPRRPRRGQTEYILRTGKPLLATPEVFDDLVRRGEVELIGVRSVDWLGVPLIAGDKTIGVLAVQSYTEGVRYGEREKEILTFVSRQVAQAIERKRAQDLQAATNERLIREAKERAQAEALRTAIYEISEAANQAESLEKLFVSIHAIVGRLMNAKNFFIALHDPATNLVSFPYFVDEVDTTPEPYPFGQGMTSYVMRSGRPLLATPGVLAELEARGEIKRLGGASIDWLGVPLKVQDRIIGVLAVQSYVGDVRYSEADELVLSYVSAQVAQAIERRRAEEALRESEERYRTILQNMIEGYYEVDIKGNMTFCNDFMANLLGRTREELVGLNNRAYMDEANAKQVFRTFNEIYRTGAPPKVLEWELIRSDGTHIMVENSVALQHDDEGRPVGFRGLVRDITEQKRAEAALRESEERFRSLFEQSPIGIYRTTPDGRILVANPALVQMLGYASVDELRSQNLEESSFQPRHRRQAFKDAIEREGEVRGFEAVWTTKEGRRLFVRENAHAIRDADGRTLYYEGTVEDVTAEREATEALVRSEAQYRHLFESANDAIVVFAPETEMILDANPKACELYGYTHDELIGISLKGLTVDVGRGEEKIAELLQGRPHSDFETIHLRRDGSQVHLQTSGSIVDYGGTRAVLATARDITQRKKSEEERKRLVAAIEQSAEGVLITDSHGTILYVNPAFEQITGYRADEALGLNPRVLKSGKQDPSFYAKMWNTITHGSVWTGKLSNRRKDGSLYQEEMSISPVRDERGEIMNFVAVKRDVTLELALQQQLAYAQKMEAVGQLAGGVAHDFNNLLQALISHVQLLRNHANEPEKVASLGREVEQLISRGASLTRQLLLFSRRDTVKPEPLDLNEQVREATTMLQRLVKANITVRVELAPQSLPVDADRGQLDQVLMNLVVNASDAMPDGGELTISTGTIDHTKVWLSVRDTGIGIPEEIRERIFEPFFTTKGAGKGTGLGLSVVDGIVTQHGGRIEVESHIGSGTTFKVILPGARPRKLPAVKEVPLAAAELPVGNGERILVVEDENAARQGLHDILVSLEYWVMSVGTGEAAASLPADFPFDLLLTDLVLPGIDGSEVARRLVQRWPRLKVVLMSGYTEDEAVHRGVAKGNVRFLQKPFDISTLARELRAALETD